jgi:putative Holliday junction resolvase
LESNKGVRISRILGLDIGDSRIGLALSDPLRILATPLTIVSRADESSAIEKIAGIIRKNEVGLVIAGLPLNMDGSQGIQADKTRSFAETLSRHIEVPVEYRDERLTTVSARELMQEAGRKNRDTRYDAAAAALILQSYLDDVANRSSGDTVPPDE